MLMRMTSVVLIMSVLTTSSLAAVDQEPQSAVSKIRETVMKAVEKRRLVTVILKIKRENRNKYSGTPGNITEQGFTLVDGKSGAQAQFQFEEIQDAKMKGSHVKLIVGSVAAGIAAVVILLVLRSELNKS